MRHFCVVLAVVCCLAASEVSAFDRLPFHPDLTTMERVRLAFLQGIAAAYAFTLGAVLGSFLNVVIYRLPRGKNIVRPASRCPECATPIKLRDNIPVLGWLALRGKCRICGGPISPRYPLVEATVGGILLGLFWIEARLGGINLPQWSPLPLDDMMLLSWRMPWGNLLLAAYHSWLLVALLVMLLIQADGFRVPSVLVRLSLAVGLLLPLAGPWLHPVPAFAPALPSEIRPWWHGPVDGLAGMIEGAVLGLLLSILLPRGTDALARRADLIAALAIIGAFLGWQAAFCIAVLSAAGLLVVRVFCMFLPAANRVPPLLWPSLVTLFYMPFWKQAAAWTASLLPFTGR